MNISEMRKNKGLTQARLGQLVGVSQQQIAKYENGRSSPSKKAIKRIASALGLSSYDVWQMFYSKDDEQ